MMSKHSFPHLETIDPLYADECNFYKVEKWTEDEQHITDLLYAGSDLATKAHDGIRVVHQEAARSASDHPAEVARDP